MSPPSLYDLGYNEMTPEEVAAGRARIPGDIGKFANSILTMPLSLAAPDPRLTEMTGGPAALNYIPLTGLAETAAGIVSGIHDAVGGVRDALVGPNKYNLNIPGMDTLRELGQHGEATRAEIQGQVANVIPPLVAPDQSDPTDRTIDTIGSMIGFGLPLAPAKAVAAASKALPTGTKWLTHLVPSTENVPKQMATMAGIGGANVLLEKGAEAADAATVPSFNDYVTKTQEQAQPLAQQVQAPTPATPDQLPSFNDYLAQPQDKAVPMFQDQGVGNVPVWGALASLAGVLVAVGAGKMTHSIGAKVTEDSRTARFNDPVYAAKAQDYNNSKIARGGAEILSEPTTPPLAEGNKVHQGANAVNTAVLDQTAGMQDAIRMMAEPTTAESLAHQYGDTHNDMSMNVKTHALRETGYDPESGVQMVAPNRVWRRIDSLDSVQQDVMTRGLSAADEMDNRNANRMTFRNAKGNAAVPAPEDIRHNFKNQTDEQLQVHVNNMMNDPNLAPIATDFWGLGKGMIEMGRKRGFFTTTEADELLKTHPRYVPEVGVTGETLHPIGNRDRTVATGVDQVNSKPWFNMAQHIDELHKQFEINDLNRKMDQSFREGMRKNPGAAQFIYDATPPTKTHSFYSGGPFREPIVTIRTASGPKYSRIDHPDIYNAFTGDSLKKKQILAEAMTIPRRLFQKGTTGSLSLATGYMAPVVNATYAGLTMGVNAPKKYYGGLLNKAGQRLTGHDSSLLRGIDTVTTNIPGAIYSYGRGAADRMTHRAAEWLDRSATNPINRTLRSYVGDAQVDGMQQALDRYYLSTKTAQMQQRGIGGMGIPIKTDLPTLQMAADKTASLGSAREVPELFHADGWKIPGTDTATKPFFIRLNRVVEDAMSSLSDAGHEYFARLNWDNPNVNRRNLGYETRRLTGDPGVRGGSTKLGIASSILPYANISMQGVGRLGRSIGERPLNSTLTLVSALGTLAATELLTHMRSQQHMDYLENQVSTQQRAANVILATSDDPARATMVKIPQEFRAIYALVLDLMSKGINTVATMHDATTYTGVMEALKDFLGGHITASSEDAILHGVVDVTSAANLPPYAGQFDQFQMMHGKGLFESYRNPVGTSSATLPNQVPDGPLDDKNGKVMSKIFSNIFGMAGVAFDDLNNTVRYAKQTGSWADALGTTGHDWLLGFQDKNPQTNVLFEHQLRLSLQPPIVERTERELDWMKQITGARTEPVAEGFTSRSRSALPVPTSSEQKIPTDPTMAQMYFAIGNYYSRMAPQLQEITDIRKQMTAVQQQSMSVTERRAWMNDQTRVLADKYRFLHDVVNDTSYAMSQIAGRPLHVGQSIDWTKGPEQFD